MWKTLRKPTSRRSAAALLASVFLIGTLACSTGRSDSDDVIKLKVADSLPEGHTLSAEGIQYWMKRVRELYNGQIEFEHYPAGQLAEADSLLAATRDGLTDIGYVVPDYASDEMPLSGVAGLPGYYQDSVTGSAAFSEVLRDPLTELEFVPNGIRPLFGVTMPPYQIMTTSRSVTSLDAWRGLKIRSSGGSQDLTIERLGAAPVSLPGPEIYTALQRGTTDGTMLPISSIPSYNLQEVLSYTTVNARLGGTGVTFSINNDVWNELPDELRDAMRKASDETVAHLSKALDNEVEQVISEFKDDMTMTELPDNTVQQWNERLEPVVEKWAADRKSRGLKADEVLRAWEAAVNKAENKS